MIAAPHVRDVLHDLTGLADQLAIELELRCACRCRCHTPIGWSTDSPGVCRGIIEPESLDCPYACRGERGCELTPTTPPRRAHV